MIHQMIHTDQGLQLRQRRRSRQRSGQSLQLGLIGFLTGVAVMGGVWWVNTGPRQTLSVFWLTSPDNTVYYVQQERSFRATSLQQGIAQALQTLIRGSSDARLISTVPPRTELLGVKVEGDDVFINFSQEFTEGGGTSAILGRISQVFYTTTSHNDQARVWISVEGEALAQLGGEGLLIDQPLTLESFKPNFDSRVVFNGVAELDRYARQVAEVAEPWN